jgi:DNA-binding CsgD family transcriptional regulator
MSDALESDPGEMLGGRVSLAMFVLIAVLMATDVAIELWRGVPMALEAFELVIFVAALGGIAVHWRQMASERERSERLHRELAAVHSEARRFSQEAQDVLAGLGAAMDRQFDKWGLTPAEREVALLQLKGLRHRAIAELRHTSERTVRQQALSIYRKSGLNGRTDLAAFFLEDLLLPSARSQKNP